MYAARLAIERIMSDTSVSPEETANRLKELRDLIDENLTSLKEDGVDVGNTF